MKCNTVTNQWLVDRKEKIRVSNEAFKAMTKRAAKKTAGYGFMSLAIVSGLSCTGVYTTMKIQDFFKNNEVAFALPVEAKVWTNRVVSVKAVEKPKTVLVEKDTTRIKVIEHAKDKTLVQKVYDAFNAKGLDGQKGVAVMYAESGGNCNAVGVNSDSADLGLFQLNTKYQLPKSNLKDFGDCDKNLEYAVNLVVEQGWGVFSSVNSGAYLRFYDTDLSYAGQ